MCSRQNVDKVAEIENKNVYRQIWFTFRKKRKKVRASSINYAHITWHKCLFSVRLKPPGGMCFYEKQYFTMSKKYLFGVGN